MSYVQYLYALDFMYQKEVNCIMLTICLLSRLCVSERRELYHSNNVRLIETFWQRKIKGIAFLYLKL